MLFIILVVRLNLFPILIHSKVHGLFISRDILHFVVCFHVYVVWPHKSNEMRYYKNESAVSPLCKKDFKIWLSKGLFTWEFSSGMNLSRCLVIFFLLFTWWYMISSRDEFIPAQFHPGMKHRNEMSSRDETWRKTPCKQSFPGWNVMLCKHGRDEFNLGGTTYPRMNTLM